METLGFTYISTVCEMTELWVETGSPFGASALVFSNPDQIPSKGDWQEEPGQGQSPHHFMFQGARANVLLQ